MDKILAKAQEFAAQKEMLDKERLQAKLDKEYRDIQLQLKATLGEDAQEIIDGGKPYYVSNGEDVYLQNGDWLFNTGGWYEKPTCNIFHIDLHHRHSHNWTHFSDVATLGYAIKKCLQELENQIQREKENAEREEACRNANPDRAAMGLFKRLIADISRWDNERYNHLTHGQRLLISLAMYLANIEEIPEWDEPDEPVEDESED